jgi:hypothetical protein
MHFVGHIDCYLTLSQSRDVYRRGSRIIRSTRSQGYEGGSEGRMSHTSRGKVDRIYHMEYAKHCRLAFISVSSSRSFHFAELIFIKSNVLYNLSRFRIAYIVDNSVQHTCLTSNTYFTWRTRAQAGWDTLPVENLKPNNCFHNIITSPIFCPYKVWPLFLKAYYFSHSCGSIIYCAAKIRVNFLKICWTFYFLG